MIDDFKCTMVSKTPETELKSEFSLLTMNLEEVFAFLKSKPFSELNEGDLFLLKSIGLCQKGFGGTVWSIVFHCKVKKVEADQRCIPVTIEAKAIEVLNGGYTKSKGPTESAGG